MITVRQVTPEDMPTLTAWAERRGCLLEPRLLSPHGFLAVNGDTPLICAWAALMMDVPIVQVDHVYLPRRFVTGDMREAWASIIEAVRAWVKLINERHGYGYSLIEIVMNPVMEFEAQRAGGEVSQRTFKKCHYLV
jgi:hypothetical protein